MRKDQIPDFIDEIIATGCPITAVGHDMYVFAEIDAPEEDIDRIAEEIQVICAVWDASSTCRVKPYTEKGC